MLLSRRPYLCVAQLTYICVLHNMGPVKIHFAQSARRHRIGKAHALWVINHFEAIREMAPDGSGKADRLMWVGRDDRGLELEVIAIELIEVLLVIHVMPMNFRRRKANG